MTERQAKILRQAYHSLSEQRRFLDETAQTNPYLIEQPVLLLIADEFQGVEQEFPGLLPAFDRNLTGTRRLPVVRSWLGAAIGRLRAETEERATIPVTESRDFQF